MTTAHEPDKGQKRIRTVSYNVVAWVATYQVELYTKYDIEYHMVFDVTTTTSRMTLLINKFTTIVMGDGRVIPFAKTLPHPSPPTTTIILPWFRVYPPFRPREILEQWSRLLARV